MKKVVFFILALLPISAFGQSSRDVLKKKPIDECRLAVTYSLKYYQDTINNKPVYDRTVLEIGDRFSHYYSALADMRDSIFYKARRENIGAVGNRAGLKADEEPRFEDVYMNYPVKGKLTAWRQIIAYEYVYEEYMPDIEWQVDLADRQEIIGYECSSAKALFRGRLWEVWFTTEVPVNSGPWKLSGLPGLILKASDSDGYFEFTAIGIENTPDRHIYVYDPKLKTTQPGAPEMTVIRSNRKDVMKLEEMLWKDYVGVALGSGRQGVNVVDKETGTFRPAKPGDIVRPYVPPLELE